jgi:hypothetical protein
LLALMVTPMVLLGNALIEVRCKSAGKDQAEN